MKTAEYLFTGAFYLEMINLLLGMLALATGMLMKSTQSLIWEICFYILIATIGICSIIAIVFTSILFKKFVPKRKGGKSE